MATIPKAVFSSGGYNIIFYIVAHNMQFSMQHRALLFLFAGGNQGYFAGEGLMDPVYSMAMISSLTPYKATK